jgi:hypothetical protein
MKSTLIRLAAAALLLAACDPQQPKPAPPTPAATADPARDLGAGTPGAGCATSRLGEHFVQNGVTYTCKGPKPYRWRP